MYELLDADLVWECGGLTRYVNRCATRVMFLAAVLLVLVFVPGARAGSFGVAASLP